MTTRRNASDDANLIALRARLEANGRAVKEARARDALQQTGQEAWTYFPHHYRRVMLWLQEAGVLAKARIDHVEHDMRRIDFAWVEKQIGLRVNPWPLRGDSSRSIPDYIYNDAALRERGWLILSIDPFSPNCKNQIDRVVSVVKRVGAPRKEGGR